MSKKQPGSKRPESKNPEAGVSPLESMRRLYADGDYKGARQRALALLSDEEAGAEEKAAAQAIVESTKIAKPSLIAGLIVLAILAVLYAWVLAQPHTH